MTARVAARHRRRRTPVLRVTSVRTRRRRQSRQAVSRAVTFGPALALPAWGWTQLGQPGQVAGLLVLLALGVFIIPAVIVLAVFLVPRSGAALVTRQRRKRYRGNLVSRGVTREHQRSARIPEFLRRVTYAADRHRCAYCHSRENLQCDHYLPWSQGGLTVPWNLITLCRGCNITKSNYWPGVHYRPLEGSDNLTLAIAILAAERRHRYSPLRLTRAAWALGA